MTNIQLNLSIFLQNLNDQRILTFTPFTGLPNKKYISSKNYILKNYLSMFYLFACVIV